MTMQYLWSVYAGLVFGAVLGGAVGVVVQAVTSQAGWPLVVGSLGACVGAFWAGLRRAERKLFWSRRDRDG